MGGEEGGRRSGERGVKKREERRTEGGKKFNIFLI